MILTGCSDCLPLSAKQPRLGGETTILPSLYYAQGPCGSGNHRDGLSCPVIWEDLMSELSWDCQRPNTVSPYGLVSHSRWLGFEMEPPESPRRNPECMFQEKQVIATRPLWLYLRGHIASLLPYFVDQNSPKSSQIWEEGTETHTVPLKGDMSKSSGAMFLNGHTDI